MSTQPSTTRCEAIFVHNNNHHSGPRSRAVTVLVTPDQKTTHSQFRIDVERRPGFPVVAHVRGAVDQLSTPELRSCVDHHVTNQNGFVLDLCAVDFLAVAGLSVLMDTERRAEREHLRWALVASSRAVARPLSATGLAATLPTYNDLRQAVAAV